jgi:hypothetical protein
MQIIDIEARKKKLEVTQRAFLTFSLALLKSKLFLQGREFRFSCHDPFPIQLLNHLTGVRSQEGIGNSLGPCWSRATRLCGSPRCSRTGSRTTKLIGSSIGPQCDPYSACRAISICDQWSATRAAACCPPARFMRHGRDFHPKSLSPRPSLKFSKAPSILDAIHSPRTVPNAPGSPDRVYRL